MDLEEQELTAYLKFARSFMEHPSKLLTSTDNPYKLRQIWSAVFEELPTYEEILSETPKLSLAFELCKEANDGEVELVIPRGIEPLFPG